MTFEQDAENGLWVPPELYDVNRDFAPNVTMVLSSHFNGPTERGHGAMIAHAVDLAGEVVLIINNDDQQVMKKGHILTEADGTLRTLERRTELLEGMLDKLGLAVAQIIPAIDTDETIVETLRMVHKDTPEDRVLVFGNGGDRAEVKDVPETRVCQELGIVMAFGVGGTDKPTSSSEENEAMGVK